MRHRRPSKLVVSAVVAWAGRAWLALGSPTRRKPRRSGSRRTTSRWHPTRWSCRHASPPVRRWRRCCTLQHVAAEDAAQLVAQTATVFDLRRVRANQPYRLETRPSGALRQFDYEIDGDRFLRVTRGSDALEAAVLPIPKTRRLERITGQIIVLHRRWSQRWMPPAKQSI